MDFQRARIINQIDKKFIFITIALSNGSLIALIDQHAADERFRLETIIQGLSADVRQMQSPLEIPFPQKDLEKLVHRKDKLGQWGLEIDVLDEKIEIKTVPKILEDIEVTRWKTILVQYVREDGYDCPSGLMNIFCSKACRSVSSSQAECDDRQSCSTTFLQSTTARESFIA